MAKPTALCKWADTLQAYAISGLNNRVKPPAGWEDLGWDENEEPPPNYENWWKYNANEWLKYFDQTAIRCATAIVVSSGATQAMQDMVEVITGTKTNGWICDGTNDHVQINAALSALNTAGGGLLLLSEGDFEIDSDLTMYDNVVVMGMGRSTRLRAKSGSSNDFIFFDCSSASGWVITNLQIDGYSSAHTGSSTGIQVDGGSQWLIDKVWITDNNNGGSGGGVGIDVVSCDGGSIKSCNLTIATTANLQIGSSAVNVRVSDTYANGEPYGFHDSGTGTTFTNCIAEDASSYGFYLTGADTQVSNCRAIECDRGFGLDYVDWCTVVGCFAKDSGKQGFYLNVAVESSLVACFSYGSSKDTDDTYAQFYVGGGSDITVTACKARHSGSGNQPSHAIELYTGSSIARCYVYGNDFYEGCKAGNAAVLDGSGYGLTIPEWISTGADSSSSNNVQNDLTKANITYVSP